MENIIKFLKNEKIIVKPCAPFGNLEINFLDDLSKILPNLTFYFKLRQEEYPNWDKFYPLFLTINQLKKINGNDDG